AARWRRQRTRPAQVFRGSRPASARQGAGPCRAVADRGRSARGGVVLAAGPRVRRRVSRTGGGLAMSRRRDVEVFGLSFLDCICCGFGAIVLLLVLSKSAEPTISEQTTETLSAREAQLRQLAEEIAG